MSGVKWDPVLVQGIYKMIAGSSFEAYSAHRDVHFRTLCHNDFHAGNTLWVSDEQRNVVIDWSEVGFGSGPTDIGQYVVSNLSPEFRRKDETQLLQAYYAELVSRGVNDHSFEDCKRLYVLGATERWTCLLVLLAVIGLANKPPLVDPVIQWFRDQVLLFVTDHGVSPDAEFPSVMTSCYALPKG